jgi:hypothetical protein
LDPLSEFVLCDLHRSEMDKTYNTVCTKYDPAPPSNSNMTYIYILVPILVVVLLCIGALIYLEHKRRQSDAVWKISKEELKFSDPPEVAGRGTFGLVVIAEYRGTTVAVKRVIPPKDAVSVATNPKASMDLVGHQPKRNSMDSISVYFDDKDNTKNKQSISMAVDVENDGGIQNLRGSMQQCILSSMEMDEPTAMSSGATLNSKQSVFKWFGLKKSKGKNYEQLKHDFIIEMRTLSKLRHPCITTVSCVLYY